MEWNSGNIFIRTISMPAAGEVIHGHKHNFDHTSIVFTGAIHISATLPNGSRVERDFRAPAHVLIRKDVEHEITSLEPGTEFWCVYSHRNPQGEVTQEDTGWDKSYG